MVHMKVHYQGGKHCELSHGPSGSAIETDAPKDNNGKGERFSPTDLVGAALGSCMLTVMAIAAEKDGLELAGATAEVTKEMAANPRRISVLTVTLRLPRHVPQERRAFLEQVGHGCPVARSLHPDLALRVSFNWDLG